LINVTFLNIYVYYKNPRFGIIFANLSETHIENEYIFLNYFNKLRRKKVRKYVVLITTLIFLVVLCVVPKASFAINASPHSYEVMQPDGNRIKLKIKGNEYYHWEEDLNGYTVVKKNGKFVYGKRNFNGHVVPTDHEVGKANPQALGLSKHIVPTLEVLKKSRPDFSSAPGDENSSSDSPIPPESLVSGALKNLVVLIRFADHTSRFLPSTDDIFVLFNEIGGDSVLAPTGSVRDVFLENSYGQLDLNSTVYAWITVSGNEAYYANGNSGLSSRIWEALIEALDQVDYGLDFNQFDQDSDGYIDAITFIHSGYGAEWGGDDIYGTPSSDRIWSHKWGIQPAWVSDEGVRVGSYHISPGLWGTSGSQIGHIGVIAHETGHYLGLPDLYDTDNGDSGNGIGSYGLMANSWGFDGSQLYPPHMCPWSKIQLGWVSPIEINASGTYTVNQVEDTPEVYRINLGYPSDEYLLIENRQPVGFDGDMPQGGLAIWHIDDAAGYNTQGYPGQQGWPENGNHYRVALLQADGDYDLEKGNNRGDRGDIYHGAGILTINPSTIPNTNAYQDGVVIETGNTISDISESSVLMTFTFDNNNSGGQINIASSDYSLIHGVVNGSYVNTHSRDYEYQSITESHSGGKPKNRYDWLEHIWSFSLSGGNHIFNIYAHCVDTGDNDSGFDFYWTQNPSGPWTYMLTVTALDDTYKKFDIGDIPGPVYVRVIDNDQTPGQNNNDTLRVDYMFFDGGQPPTDFPGTASNPQPTNGATNVGINPILSWDPGDGSDSSDVYFGMDPDLGGFFQGNQVGTTFSPGDLLYNTSYYWRIDEVNGLGTSTGAVWSFTTGNEPPSPTNVYVESIQVSTVSGSKGRKYGQVMVTIFDDNDSPVSGAVVTGIFTGDFEETHFGTTDNSGVAVITTSSQTKKPSYEFCVDDVVHGTLTYEPNDNVEVCKSY